MQRRVLVILSNRLHRAAPIRHIELVCETDGTIVEQRQLRRAPTKAVYDEVWENDDGKTDLDSCNRVKRHYKHPLIAPAKPAPAKATKAAKPAKATKPAAATKKAAKPAAKAAKKK